MKTFKNFDKETVLNALLEMDGSHWQRAGHDRFYFNKEKICEILDLEYGTYNTGNVSWAKMDGEKISNGKASRILFGLKESKIYFDFEGMVFRCTGTFEYKSFTKEALEEELEAILNGTNTETA